MKQLRVQSTSKDIQWCDLATTLVIEDTCSFVQNNVGSVRRQKVQTSSGSGKGKVKSNKTPKKGLRP